MLHPLVITILALPYVVATLLGLLLPLLTVWSYAKPWSGMALMLMIFTAEALYMQLSGLQLGLTLYYTDMVLAFVGGVAALRMATLRDAPRLPRAWLIYTLVFIVSLGTGLASYGSTAGVQARGYFYSIAATLYMLSFAVNERHVRWLFDGLTAVSVVLLLLCVYRWVVYYLPIPDLLPELGTYNIDGAIRVIDSQEALVLAQVMVLSLFFGSTSLGLTWMRALSPLLLLSVIVLQHRSVWVALLSGLLTSLLLARSRKGSKGGQIWLLLAVVASALLPLIAGQQLGGVGEQVVSSASNALSGKGTAGERLDSWQEVIKNWAAAGPRSIAIGQSFGTDNTRYVADSTNGGTRKIDYIAHNHYVQTLFNLGLVGLVSFVAVAVWVSKELYRLHLSGRGGGMASPLLVLVVMQLVYYIPYGTDYLQHMIFGVAMAFVLAHRLPSETKTRALVRRHWRWT